MSESKKLYRAQDSYAAKQREKGLVRVAVWVPEADRKELTEIAKEMCQDAAQQS